MPCTACERRKNQAEQPALSSNLNATRYTLRSEATSDPIMLMKGYIDTESTSSDDVLSWLPQHLQKSMVSRVATLTILPQFATKCSAQSTVLHQIFHQRPSLSLFRTCYTCTRKEPRNNDIMLTYKLRQTRK